MRRPVTLLMLVAVAAGISACGAPENGQPTCRSEPPTLLMAESVPGASLIPCIDALPGGWTFQAFEADETHAAFSLEQQDGDGVLDVEFVASCAVSGSGTAVEGFPTAQRYDVVENGGAGVVWTSTFPGGCSRARLSFSAPPPQVEVDRIERALSFIARADLRPP
jgi:hypothetical protein